MKSTVMDEVRKVFNPEFLNRIDEIIVFRALERPQLERIVEILLDQVRDRLQGARDHPHDDARSDEPPPREGV